MANRKAQPDPKPKIAAEAGEDYKQPASERIPDYHGKRVIIRKQRRILVGEQGRAGQWMYITELEGNDRRSRETSGVWYGAEQMELVK